ncbi:uncharacterized protein LOC141902407 [Tubulanus polymorphus]|uniref:uncharacterized protein LOC141902407 n=1 Tax=Tubulanus polymorphus TaxID=672921 RepID=UPI003DA5F6BE
MTTEDSGLRARNVHKLHQLSQYYQSECPPLGRFYSSCILTKSVVENISTDNTRQIPTSCLYCHNPFWPNGCRMVLRAKMPANERTRKLSKRASVRGTNALSGKHRHVVEKFERSCSRVKITCNLCGKHQLVDGRSRADLDAKNAAASAARAAEREVPAEPLTKAQKKRKKKKERYESKNSAAQISAAVSTANRPETAIRTDDRVRSAKFGARKHRDRVVEAVNSRPASSASSSKSGNRKKEGKLQKLLLDSKRQSGKPTGSSLQDFLSSL